MGSRVTHAGLLSLACAAGGCHGQGLSLAAPAPEADGGARADATTLIDSGITVEAGGADLPAAPARFPASTRWAACMTLGQPYYVFSLAASPDGRFLAAGAADTTIWDLGDHSLFRMVSSDGGLKPTFSRDSSLLALGGDARTVVRLSDGVTVTPISNGASGCIAWSSEAVVSPDNEVVALGTCSAVERYGRDGQLLGALPSHVFSPGVAYSSDGRFLATSGPELWRADGSERLWPAEIVPGPGPREVGPPEDFLTDNTVAFSPDGTQLLVSNAPPDPPGYPPSHWKASTQLVRVADGTLVRDFGGDLPRHPSFAPDGSWIAAAGRVVHLASGTVVSLGEAIAVSTFLPDGRIAAADESRVVRIYCPEP
jgi:WD40 repeat protein